MALRGCARALSSQPCSLLGSSAHLSPGAEALHCLLTQTDTARFRCAVQTSKQRNSVRPGVKTEDGPGWRESRGESALENKIQCSLRRTGYTELAVASPPLPLSISSQYRDSTAAAAHAAVATWQAAGCPKQRALDRKQELPADPCERAGAVRGGENRLGTKSGAQRNGAEQDGEYSEQKRTNTGDVAKVTKRQTNSEGR
ncbi:uncharacterized protein VSU04_012650 [Chlamydotis macqueenii]